MGEAHHSKMQKYEQGKISNFFPWDTQILIEHSVKKSLSHLLHSAVIFYQLQSEFDTFKLQITEEKNASC